MLNKKNPTSIPVAIMPSNELNKATPSYVYPDGRVSPEDAANFLGLAPKTLATWRYLRKGPSYVKCGSRVFYYLKELEDWVRQNTIRCCPPQ